VVAVHVAAASALARPGPVEDAAVPAVVWTVDAESGRVEAPSSPRGGPYGGLRGRMPGFSSPRRWVPMLSWVGYVTAFLVAAFLVGLIPQAVVAVFAGNHG
jgi:hypothetical protein